MSESQFALLRQAIAAQTGHEIVKSNGQWTLKRVNKTVPGLAPARPIKIKVGPKPKGSPGRGEKWGYNLQVKLGLNDEDYDLLYDNHKTIICHTFGIDTAQPISKQPKASLRDAIQTVYSIHTELEAFRKLRDWASMAFFNVILRRKACQYQKKYGSPTKIKARKRRAKPTTHNKETEASVHTNQAATIGDQAATISNQAATIGDQMVTTGNQTAAIGDQAATIGNQAATIGNQAAAIGDQAATIAAGTQADSVADAQAANAADDLHVPSSTNPLAHATQDGNNKESGEYIDLDNIDSDLDDEDEDCDTARRDTTMCDSSNMRIDPNKSVSMFFDPNPAESEEEDDDDGGVIDLSRAASEPLPARQTEPHSSSTRASAPPEATRWLNPATSGSQVTSKSPAPSINPASHISPTRAPTPDSTPSIPHAVARAAARTLPSDTTSGATSDSAPDAAPDSAPIATSNTTNPNVATAETAGTGRAPAPATTPVPAPFATHSGTDGSVVWRGLVITAKVLSQLRILAKRQFDGEMVRVPPMYQDLVDILSVDPDYDPSSDPHPPAKSSIPTPSPATKVRAKPNSRPESMPNAKHKAEPEPERSISEDAVSTMTGDQAPTTSGKKKQASKSKATGAGKATKAKKAAAIQENGVAVAEVGTGKGKEVAEGEHAAGVGVIVTEPLNKKPPQVS
ncbi:protein phosphatase 2C [Ceratobasidium sp. AG-Ba]|nr:protein phosphatase 2C [Ceratobasidium sp. AG-Ba]